MVALISSSYRLAVLICAAVHALADTQTIQRSRCAVKDFISIHPELERVPSTRFKFMSTINARLTSRLKTSRDGDAFAALFNSKMECHERYIIPVAWHVVHSSTGIGKVAKKTLEKQLQVLNDAFHDTPFVFRTRSIDYSANDEWIKSCIQNAPEFKRALSISPTTTLNVYTCKFTGQDSAIGSASMPWWYEESNVYHGIVIHPETLPGGTLVPINLGKNAVHEAGHYFGLFHIFEGGCTNRDDGVEDTPRCKPSYGCPSGSKDTCPQQPGKDPIQNYMGYTDDACMTQFTAGQIKRMEWAVEKYRPTLMKTVEYPCTIDAVFRWSNGHIYIFSGSSYYRYNESIPGLDPDYPRPISSHWVGVPSNVDGAFRYANGITYFFKGKYFYRYNDLSGRVDPGFPRNISEFWRGVPSDINDVISSANSYTYFFKGAQYYRFNPRTHSVDVGYPKGINEYWVNVPKDIEAAVSWYNGGVYFFKDAQFWFFMHGVKAAGEYPKPVRVWWKGNMGLSGYAIFRYSNGLSYFFQGSEYWRFNDNLYHVDFQYPKPITQAWTGIPTSIDAAFTWSNNRMYFFKGSHYYRFNTTAGQVDQGYPRRIDGFWRRVPRDIDAVFRYVNGRTYFFKGSDYFRFNDTVLQVDGGYPRAIASFWKGIPDRIDSVFVWSNGHTYFFKGNLYYRFNCKTKQVDTGYPKSISRWRGMLYNP